MMDVREKICPKCGSPSLKAWTELDVDQKMLAERLPASAEFSRKEGEKHRICTQCWFESDEHQPTMC